MSTCVDTLLSLGPGRWVDTASSVFTQNNYNLKLVFYGEKYKWQEFYEEMLE